MKSVHIVAKVLAVRNTYAYPCCSKCRRKLRLKEEDQDSWWCYSCQKCYENSNVPYRYYMKFTVTDHSGIAYVTVFGKSLNHFFGVTATEFCRYVGECEKQRKSEDFNIKHLVQFLVEKCFLGSIILLLFQNKGDMRASCHSPTLEHIVHSHKNTSFLHYSPHQNEHKIPELIANHIVKVKCQYFHVPSIFDNLKAFIEQPRNVKCVEEKLEATCYTSDESCFDERSDINQETESSEDICIPDNFASDDHPVLSLLSIDQSDSGLINQTTQQQNNSSPYTSYKVELKQLEQSFVYTPDCSNFLQLYTSFKQDKTGSSTSQKNKSNQDYTNTNIDQDNIKAFNKTNAQLSNHDENKSNNHGSGDRCNNHDIESNNQLNNANNDRSNYYNTRSNNLTCNNGLNDQENQGNNNDQLNHKVDDASDYQNIIDQANNQGNDRSSYGVSLDEMSNKCQTPSFTNTSSTNIHNAIKQEDIEDIFYPPCSHDLDAFLADISSTYLKDKCEVNHKFIKYSPPCGLKRDGTKFRLSTTQEIDCNNQSKHGSSSKKLCVSEQKMLFSNVDAGYASPELFTCTQQLFEDSSHYRERFPEGQDSHFDTPLSSMSFNTSTPLPLPRTKNISSTVLFPENVSDTSNTSWKPLRQHNTTVNKQKSPETVAILKNKTNNFQKNIDEILSSSPLLF